MFPYFLLFDIHDCCLEWVALAHLPHFLAENMSLDSIWSCSTSGLISRLRLVPAQHIPPPALMLGPFQPCSSLQGRENELGSKLDTESGWPFGHRGQDTWLSVLQCHHCCCHYCYYGGWSCCTCLKDITFSAVTVYQELFKGLYTLHLI